MTKRVKRKNKNPKDRIKMFELFGFKTLVIWHNELKHNQNLTEFRIHRFMTK